MEEVKGKEGLGPKDLARRTNFKKGHFLNFKRLLEFPRDQPPGPKLPGLNWRKLLII